MGRFLTWYHPIYAIRHVSSAFNAGNGMIKSALRVDFTELERLPFHCRRFTKRSCYVTLPFQ